MTMTKFKSSLERGRPPLDELKFFQDSNGRRADGSLKFRWLVVSPTTNQHVSAAQYLYWYHYGTWEKGWVPKFKNCSAPLDTSAANLVLLPYRQSRSAAHYTERGKIMNNKILSKLRFKGVNLNKNQIDNMEKNGKDRDVINAIQDLKAGESFDIDFKVREWFVSGEFIKTMEEFGYPTQKALAAAVSAEGSPIDGSTISNFKKQLPSVVSSQMINFYSFFFNEDGSKKLRNKYIGGPVVAPTVKKSKAKPKKKKAKLSDEDAKILHYMQEQYGHDFDLLKEEFGLTQRDIGDVLHLDNTTISGYCRGNVRQVTPTVRMAFEDMKKRMHLYHEHITSMHYSKDIDCSLATDYSFSEVASMFGESFEEPVVELEPQDSTMTEIFDHLNSIETTLNIFVYDKESTRDALIEKIYNSKDCFFNESFDRSAAIQEVAKLDRECSLIYTELLKIDSIRNLLNNK